MSAYTLDRVTSLTVKINGQTKTVANTITYEPMGPVTQLAFGNGGGRIHYYDTDYRLTDIVTDLKVGYHFDFDANDRITGYTNFANGEWSQNFGYDDVQRLKTASSPGLGSQSFTYDPNGNRKTLNATNYTIANSSNRLLSEGGRTYAYSPTGNVKTITGFGIGSGDDLFRNGFQFEPSPVTTFAYDPFDRLTGVTGPGISASYKLGPDGTRYQKTANGETTRFVYGPNGMLLSEHRQTPARWTHYLWLNGQPVALVRNNTLYWIQTDHLGRPEGITDHAKQRVWRATLRAFDRKVIDDDIGGFHLGFPGQYHDTETGFAHNINRTYMSGGGRYLEVDPIGLAGGINPYIYTNNNPVNLIDPLGLDARCTCRDGATNIDIPINFRGPGATPANIARITNAIRQAWSSSGFNVNVTQGNMNRIYLANGSGRSQVVNRNRGTWYAGASDWSYAHEAGHLMHLADMYMADLPFTPAFPGTEGTIMGSYGGIVTEADRNEVFRALGCEYE